jgi:heat-inducible transcriptional repressor
MLDERKRQVLQAIIDDYISTAEPIGSRTIARKYGLGVSPATIRNEMSDLEALGFLEQPHASAGRIPSAKGYRFYVDCLMGPQQVSDRDTVLINQWFEQKVRRLDEAFQETVRVLSRITKNVSLLVAPQTAVCKFKYLQFLPFDETRVVVIVVTDTGVMENRLMEIPPDTSTEELQRIAGALNHWLGGMAIPEIQTTILEKIREDVLPRPELLEAALSLLREATNGTAAGEKVYLGGTTQLLNQPEFRDVEKVKNMLSMFEEDKLLYDILHTQDGAGVIVTIGQENKYSGIQDCSVIQASFRLDGQTVGTLAVLGPTRMEYARTMAAIEFMQQHMELILKKYQR